MEAPLSVNEREALARFVAKLITDVERIAGLFEKRGLDASRPRAAQADLQQTLAALSAEESSGERLQAYIPEY